MNRNVKMVLATMLLLAPAVSAQNVSQQPTKVNVMLEDFTGFNCGNCPDGHKIASRMQLAQPNRVYTVAVHAGAYAKPSANDQPNFLTDEGTAINDYFGINSYPSGMVNRKNFDMLGQIISRSNWTSCARELCQQTADVNIWVNSTYDKDTKKISTDVELYYVNGIEAGTSALCVSLLQNGILGPQAGGNMEDEYVHNHVLRAMFTPVWGDTIQTSDKGALVKRHYEYTLPDVIGNQDTDPLHSDVVAYVIDTAKTVMNISGCKLDCPGMTLPTAATLEAYKITPSRNYGFNYMECYLVNEGTDPLTSATFKMVLDDEETVECTWTASDTDAVAKLERGYVKIPVRLPAAYVASGCDYTLTLTSLNGQAYAGNTIAGSFGAMINAESDLRALIKVDRQATDNTFRLLDADGNVVAEYGPYPDEEATTYEETIKFPTTGIYCFEITDAWGNGMLLPRGSLKVYNSENTLILQNNDIAYYGYRAFFNCTKASGIEAVENAATAKTGAMYNLCGQRVSAPAKGSLYIVDGKKYISK